MAYHYCFLTPGDWDRNASFVRLREFADELAKRGHRVGVLLDDTRYNRQAVRFQPGVEKHFVPAEGALGQVLARRKMIEWLGPDYVHFINPSVTSYLALVGVREQRFVCDWDEWPARRPQPFWRAAVERYVDRWCRRRAFVRVVASKYLRRELAALGGLGDPPPAYVPYAAYLQPHPDGTSPFAEPTLVYVGNLYPAYDHDLIFEAARILKERGETPAIAILGGGPDLEKWRAYAKEHGLDNVSMPGYLTGDALWRHMRHARANLFPIRETELNLARCPSKTFAYMQARRPVLAGPVGEVAEALGDRAVYVAADPRAWADAIHGMAVISAGEPADVDYGVERHNWSERTDRLLAAIAEAEQSAAFGIPGAL